jgi:polar amino acid transport system substrate-binding protein
LFYLALTVPLTHLVNYIDRRLSKGKPAAAEIPTQEII